MVRIALAIQLSSRTHHWWTHSDQIKANQSLMFLHKSQAALFARTFAAAYLSRPVALAPFALTLSRAGSFDCESLNPPIATMEDATTTRLTWDLGEW